MPSKLLIALLHVAEALYDVSLVDELMQGDVVQLKHVMKDILIYRKLVLFR